MFSRSQSLEIITRQLCLIKCDTWHICHNLLKYSKLLAKHKTPLLLDVRWPSALQRSAAGSAVRVIIVTRTPAACSMVPGPDADTHYTDQPLEAGLWIITGCNFHTKHNLWGARGGAGVTRTHQHRPMLHRYALVLPTPDSVVVFTSNYLLVAAVQIQSHFICSIELGTISSNV